jgi:hypothetical protein
MSRAKTAKDAKFGNHLFFATFVFFARDNPTPTGAHGAPDKAFSIPNFAP